MPIAPEIVQGWLCTNEGEVVERTFCRAPWLGWHYDTPWLDLESGLKCVRHEAVPMAELDDDYIPFFASRREAALVGLRFYEARRAAAEKVCAGFARIIAETDAM